MHLSTHVSICLTIHPCVHLSIHLSIYLSIHPFIHVSVCSPIHLSMYPSITGQWMLSSAVCTNSLQNSLPECQAGCQDVYFSLQYFPTINILFFLMSVLRFPAKSCLVFQGINDSFTCGLLFVSFIAPPGQKSVEWTQTTLTLEHLPLWKYECHWQGRHLVP